MTLVAIVLLLLSKPPNTRSLAGISTFGQCSKRCHRSQGKPSRMPKSYSNRSVCSIRNFQYSKMEFVKGQYPHLRRVVEKLWRRAAQRKLRKGGNYQQLASKFGLHEDQRDVIRCKGRLEHSEMVHEAKEPIIPPKEHQLTVLQIQECRIKVLHNGVRRTLAELHSRFWVRGDKW